MSEPRRCPDCGVKPGESHDPGCDVERCRACGFQAIGCDCPEDTPATMWTGRWPGDVEVAEGLAADLNDLHRKGATGELHWSPALERWISMEHL